MLKIDTNVETVFLNDLILNCLKGKRTTLLAHYIFDQYRPTILLK